MSNGAKQDGSTTKHKEAHGTSMAAARLGDKRKSGQGRTEKNKPDKSHVAAIF